MKINIIGHSLGGTLPRFAFRFWPDIRSMVHHLIAFGPTNHGTLIANTACHLISCPIAMIQQRLNSSFICAMNSYAETFSSIKYTNILSKSDELVRPLRTSELKGKRVANIYIQDVCPYRVLTEHLALGVYDYCAYRVTIDALRSRSLTNISSEQCCAHLLMPGINATMKNFLKRATYSATEHAKQLFIYSGQAKEEPELKCSFRTDCRPRKRSLKIFHRR